MELLRVVLAAGLEAAAGAESDAPLVPVWLLQRTATAKDRRAKVEMLLETMLAQQQQQQQQQHDTSWHTAEQLCDAVLRAAGCHLFGRGDSKFLSFRGVALLLLYFKRLDHQQQLMQQPQPPQQQQPGFWDHVVQYVLSKLQCGFPEVAVWRRLAILQGWATETAAMEAAMQAAVLQEREAVAVRGGGRDLVVISAAAQLRHPDEAPVADAPEASVLVANGLELSALWSSE
jgi:hypothetical protein